ncbi:MAG: sulfite exporter TauE/SafE family protein [Bdellovibrionales bacterium]|nr:sulfite exporter TauE/SafE family protein [Bdellovibrionales bacterium]
MIVGWIGALLMGLVLGLMGAGGSIISVPVFVYLFGVPATKATGYSLFVVGFAAWIGAWRYHREKLLQYKTGLIFAIPAIIGVYTSRRFIVPSLPEIVLSSPMITKDQFILVVFSMLVLASSIKMIRSTSHTLSEAKKTHPAWLAPQGLFVGIISGFVGAGGGFLIIPALVFWGGLEMKKAVGTSLMIIALQSSIGFLGELQVNPHMNWKLLLTFCSIALIGLWIGIQKSQTVSQETLKKYFGYFLLVIALWIVGKEVLFT